MVVTAAFIRDLYKRNPPAGICAICEYCGAQEPLFDGDLFDCCARCEVCLYCSKKCQKKDWPHHKVYCNTATTNTNAKVGRRVDRFVRVYGPLLSMACSKYFLIQNIKNKCMTTADHVLLVHVSELPKDGRSIKPRLRIDKMEAMALENVPVECRDLGRENGMHQITDRSNVLSCYVLCTVPDDILMRHMMSIYVSQNNYKSLKGEPTDSMECLALIQAINGVAKGERPDLYAAIKDQHSKK